MYIFLYENSCSVISNQTTRNFRLKMWKMNTEIIKSNKEMLSKHLTYYGEKHFGTLLVNRSKGKYYTYHEYNIIYLVIIFEMSQQKEEDISVINSCCKFAKKFHFEFVFALNSSIIAVWIKLNASRYM